METLCKIRDIHRAVIEFESKFESTFALSLNEGMLLCTVAKEDLLSSGEIAEAMGLSPSNASKVIKEVENKKLIKRIMGSVDKRQMYFSLTAEGKKRTKGIDCAQMQMSDSLKKLLSY